MFLYVSARKGKFLCNGRWRTAEALSLMILRPLQCRVNPKGLLTMRERPSVTCWATEEHRTGCWCSWSWYWWIVKLAMDMFNQLLHLAAMACIHCVGFTWELEFVSTIPKTRFLSSDEFSNKNCCLFHLLFDISQPLDALWSRAWPAFYSISPVPNTSAASTLSNAYHPELQHTTSKCFCIHILLQFDPAKQLKCTNKTEKTLKIDFAKAFFKSHILSAGIVPSAHNLPSTVLFSWL